MQLLITLSIYSSLTINNYLVAP